MKKVLFALCAILWSTVVPVSYTHLRPMLMYNAMLKPLQNYTIKGFIWYQGESNVGRHETYAERLADMEIQQVEKTPDIEQPITKKKQQEEHLEHLKKPKRSRGFGMGM